MIFSEVYSSYYKAMERLVKLAQAGRLDDKTAAQIIQTTAFPESFLYILSAIAEEQWNIITKEFATPLRYPPTLPVTALEKRWLKAISRDLRFHLFLDNDIEGLSDIQPLYRNEDFYYVDQVKDGDPFESPEYISRFRTVLRAFREKRHLYIVYKSGTGNLHSGLFIPFRLEYSIKDDKFRLLTHYQSVVRIINLGRILTAELRETYNQAAVMVPVRIKRQVKLELYDRRNALERGMVHFADYQKVTEQVNKDLYYMTLSYNKEDEAEVLIRILSFGPMMKVISPPEFVDRVKERLLWQKELGKKV